MNEKEFKVETGLKIHDCLTFGISYAMPSEFIERRRKDHKTFYCPSGHEAYYPHLNKEETLSRRLETCRLDNKHLKEEVRYHDYSARYYKGKVTKIEKEMPAIKPGQFR